MVIALLLFGCDVKDGDDTAADTDTDDSTPVDTDITAGNVELDGACTDATHWGAFTIDQNEDYGYVSGSVSNGVVPASILTPLLTSGDCTIWRRENPFCDPGCDPGFTCDFDGTCVPYPEAQDLGTVLVSGLLEPVAMEPVTPGYTYFDTSVPNPPWNPGELITLRTGGGAFDPVTLHGVAPVSLAPVSMDWVVYEGKPLHVEWDAPTGSVRTEVALSLRIDQHGQTPSVLRCAFEDDGSADVPADVQAELMALGVTGFPAGDLSRRTVDNTSIGSGCVDLAATSSRLAMVSISGYTPCRSDEQCPDGMECNEALERCE